jgi:large subunit ribosomal protein L6
MSRIAKNIINMPQGVEFSQSDNVVNIKGSKGNLSHTLPQNISLINENNQIKVSLDGNTKALWALAGTTRAIVNNMVVGVSQGFEKKLALVGVGYRAQAKGSSLSLTLGFSHPVDYDVPEGITIETPKQTEILVKGIDRQKVGQVASEIRAYRPPEPYKGKGVRYANEHISLKETKKK